MNSMAETFRLVVVLVVLVVVLVVGHVFSSLDLGDAVARVHHSLANLLGLASFPNEGGCTPPPFRVPRLLPSSPLFSIEPEEECNPPLPSFLSIVATSPSLLFPFSFFFFFFFVILTWPSETLAARIVLFLSFFFLPSFLSFFYSSLISTRAIGTPFIPRMVETGNSFPLFFFPCFWMERKDFLACRNDRFISSNFLSTNF